uniref:Uncharacterized protein n=1 Tax=Avena sativa TaxID=4498 RepID=A0ACD6A801_AVESA
MHGGMAAAKGRRSCMAMDMDGLPEDVLHEVFSRVGNVKDLFMLAVTCRRWLRRFTDPAFLRGVVCPDQGQGAAAGHHRARLLGFFFQHQQQARCGERTAMNKQQRTSPTFLPAPGSPLGPTLSCYDDDDGTFNYAEPLAARRGIVLMRLVCRTFGARLFGLCNPITGERHVLPPLECSGIVSGYAIITVADSSDDLDGPGRFAFSQLLVLTSLTDVHSYSAATRSWSGPIMCPDGARLLSLAGEKSAVVHQGAAHWLLIDDHAAADNNLVLYKLSVDLQVGTVGRKAAVSLTKLPVRVGGSPLLCVSPDGKKLSVACVYLMHVTVWTPQQDDDDAEAAAWLRTVIRIPVAVPNPNYPPRKQPKEKWFDFHRGSMLVVQRSSAISVLDLEKKVMEKIMEDCLPPRFSRMLDETKSVAYEMDLVEFFLLHLGGLCGGLSLTE